MTVLLADIGFGIVPFIVKAAVVLTMLGGLALLAFIAILAAVKHRSGIAMFAGGLVVLGLLIPAGLALSYIGVRSSHMVDFSTHSTHGELPIHWTDWDDVNRQVPVWPRLGILLIIGIAIVVFTGLSRRSATNVERPSRRSWWPVLLVPALLVIAVPLFFLSFVAHDRVVIHSPPQLPPQPPVPFVHSSREEGEMSRKAARFEAELHRQIAEMDIRELMDLFDAPRIVITTPRKITFPILSNLPKPISLPVKSITILLAAAESDEELSASELDDRAEKHGGEQVEAEADAAVRIIAEAGDSSSHAWVSDAKKELVANVELENVVNESPERAVHSNGEVELTTPIAAPAPAPKADQPRPDWVKNPPQRIGEVRREVFATDEWSTERECEQARDIGLMLKTYERIQWLNGSPYREDLADRVRSLEDAAHDSRIHELQEAGITLADVHQEIAKKEYFETVERSFGPMKKLYTLIEFTPAVDRGLRQRWDAYQRQERFAVVGAGAGGVLGLLGLCYGLLKVDTWTKGYYTKRLFLGVPAAIIGLGTLLATMIFG
jgi:hypothetical protein